jgi:hypothetical protein
LGEANEQQGEEHMNDWFEYIFAFLFGLVGCVVVASILNWLLPLN